MHSAANAYLYVNHDYKTYENEVLLFTLKLVFLLFHVIQKTLFIEKNCSSVLNKVYIKFNIMYKLLGVHCDVHMVSLRRAVTTSSPNALDLDTLLFICG